MARATIKEGRQRDGHGMGNAGKEDDDRANLGGLLKSAWCGLRSTNLNRQRFRIGRPLQGSSRSREAQMGVDSALIGGSGRRRSVMQEQPPNSA